MLPNYILPGIDAQAYPQGLAFLEAAGFSRLYAAVAMNRSLVRSLVYPQDVEALLAQRRKGRLHLHPGRGQGPGGTSFNLPTPNLIPTGAELLGEGVLQGPAHGADIGARNKGEGSWVSACMGAMRGFRKGLGPLG